MMTGKELVERAIHFQEVPRIPVATLSGATWAVKEAGISPKELMQRPDAGAGLLLDAYDRMGVDVLYAGRAIPHIILRAMGGRIDHSKAGLPGEVLKKPLEDVEEISDWTPGRIMDNLHQDEEYQLLLEQIRNMRKIAGDERFIGVGSFGPFTTASQIIGVSDLLMNMIDEDYEEVTAALFQLVEEVVYQVCHEGIAAGGDLVYIAEPVSSGDLISERDFETYSLPMLKRLNERLKPECPYMLLHICGSTMERIPALKDSGISIFSMDSLDLEQALKLADGKIALMGNLSPVKVLEHENADQVYARSRQLCDTAGLGGGFILAPGCDLTPNTELANINAMVRAAAVKS